MRLIILLCAISAALALDRDRLVVTVSEGTLGGVYVAEGDYAAFYGVEYGGPTSGKHRFKAPSEVEPYNPDPNSYRVAANKDVKCAQPTKNGIIGIENCLVLDIYTKDLETKDQPVFVWLEGEDFERSNDSYPIENLVQQGLVVVSVKYRLSIFGFLCLGVPEAPGNAGLKDVILALKWIQKNIAVFGGNPKNVMLAGHGSGAAMVDMITLSPMSENLVHKALVLSGSALAPWALTRDPIADANRVAKKLNYINQTPSDLAQSFKSIDFHVLGGALTAVYSFFFNKYNYPPLFAPCIENSKLQGALLDDAPLSKLRAGMFNDIPYVAGFTDLEGTMRDDLSTFNWHYDVTQNFEKLLPSDIEYKNDVNKTTIHNFYFGAKPKYNISSFLKFQGDILVLGPATRGVVARAATSRSHVWVFEFAFSKGTNSIYSKYDKDTPGARHGELQNYLFNYNLNENGNEALAGVQSRIVEYAKTGSPQPTRTLNWQPVTSSSFRMLYINDGYRSPQSFYKEVLVDDINGNRTTFWNKIYSTNYKLPTLFNSNKSSANTLFGFGFVILLVQLIIFA